MGWSAWVSLLMAPMAQLAMAAEPTRCLMYLTGQHPIVPEYSLTKHITHVALAFMSPSVFNTDAPPEVWPLFDTVENIRPKFHPGTKFIVAIGGWGDTEGFEVGAKDAASRNRWARNVARMVEDMGADGVDVDWEYPGGNGEDYKQIPNEEKAWQILAYPFLLSDLRTQLGPDKLITAALPGLERDMLAFNHDTLPSILEQLHFVNIMTYDMLNRRDNVTKHHTGVRLSRKSLETYMDRGAPASMLNLGLAFYVKWVLTEQCDAENPVGCATQLMEDPDTGADLGRSGAFAWNDPVPDDVADSFNRALTEGQYDEEGGGYYYWDKQESRFWTFDTPDAIKRKFPALMQEMDLGGVFAWGLGEDGPHFERFRAVHEEMRSLKEEGKDEKRELRDEL